MLCIGKPRENLSFLNRIHMIDCSVQCAVKTRNLQTTVCVYAFGMVLTKVYS